MNKQISINFEDLASNARSSILQSLEEIEVADLDLADQDQQHLCFPYEALITAHPDHVKVIFGEGDTITLAISQTESTLILDLTGIWGRDELIIERDLEIARLEYEADLRAESAGIVVNDEIPFEEINEDKFK